ncbi:TIGR00180 family glycosyltransferase [Oceanibaculum nanhaiense]|uniref:TIGR00180 family glycosyltransferase n=1 Tax=Oceanibaculum nanhaiense TaxID=1909734 RepID=UPI00396DC413
MAASLLQDLTLLVPTYNRPRFFTRFLDYARASGFDMPILVADGSETPGADANAEIIARHGAGLTIEHQRYGTDVTPGLRVGIALQTVGTRYCMLCADDDFVFLPKVKEALFRLELEPDCVAIGGPMIVFTDNPAKPAPLRVHVAHDVTGPSALQRIDAHMTQYRPTFYSVFRTPAIQAAYGRGKEEFDFWPRLAELSLSAGIMAQGNYRALNGFFGMREMHPDQHSKTSGQWMDMIVHRDFSAHLEAAAAHAARILLEHEEMPFETALNAIKLAFLRFVHVTYAPTLRGTPAREVPERHAAQRAALAPMLKVPPAEIAAALRAVGMLPDAAE